MGRVKRLSSFSPFPIMPHALSFSFSPASLQHKEASVEERATGRQEEEDAKTFATDVTGLLLLCFVVIFS